MTTQQAIEQLSKLPPDAIIGSFNPVVTETIYVSRFVLAGEHKPNGPAFIQVEFNESLQDEHAFAPM